MKPKGLAKTLLGASGLTAAIVVNFASLTANAANLSWDADAIFNNGTLGGTGTWNTALANWDNGATDTTWATNTIAGDTAIFAGTAGTVTLGTNINALGLTFNTTGYTLGLNGNTLALGTGGIRTVAPGTSPLSCADIAAGDRVEINGRDRYRAGTVAEIGPYLHDPSADGDYFPCMVASADVQVDVGDSGGAVLVRGLPAGVTSRSFDGRLGFTPLAEGLQALGLELCTEPDCGLVPPP